MSFTQNDVTLDINGTINGFHVAREAKSIAGPPVPRRPPIATLTNGLPGWINLSRRRTQGLDIKAHQLRAGHQQQPDTVGLPIGNPNPNSGTQPTL